MFGVEDRHRAEALRLLRLDSEAQAAELLAHALAAQEQQRQADEQLEKLDRQFLGEIIAEVSDGEPGGDSDDGSG